LRKKRNISKLIANSGSQNLPKKHLQRNTHRIILIALSVFLAVIAVTVIYGIYDSEIKPLHESAIEVNYTNYDMAYYIDVLDAYTKNMQTESVIYIANFVTNQVVRNELIRQGAGTLSIMATSEEIELALSDTENTGEDIFRDIAETELLNNKLVDYFSSQLPYEIEQIQLNVMLVEDEFVANSVLSRIDDGVDYNTLMAEFSIEHEDNKEELWLPEELLSNSLLKEWVSTIEATSSDKIPDETVSKSRGYWLIEVTDIDDIEGINVRAMLLGSYVQAEEIRTRLDTEEFSALAREYSQHTSKEDGGELGWLKKGEIKNNTFDDIAFSLSPNLVSSPIFDVSVETVGGYWIIELLAREKHELSTEAKETLALQDFTDWLSEQENNSTIVIHLDNESESWAVKKVLKRR